MKNNIFPCLWFDGQAEVAAEFYCSVFPNSRILSRSPLVVTFEINGWRLMGLNGGPHYKFSEAISLVVNCDTQQEIDNYWNLLTADGGQEGPCGWLKDKFGVSWQIVPSNIGQLISDPAKAERVGKALSKMKKLVKAELENA